MGYCHNWYRRDKLYRNEFEAFGIALDKVLKLAEVELTYIDYNGEEVNGWLITRDVVSFNGKGKYAHETFHLPRVINVANSYREFDGRFFQFVKTNRKPYDKCVTAALILAKIHFGKSFKVTTDGELKDWLEGIDLVKRTLSGNLNVKAGNEVEVYYSEKVEIEKVDKSEVIFYACDDLENLMG